MSLLSPVESESSEALHHGLLFCWCLRALVWQEGTTLFTSVSRRDPKGLQRPGRLCQGCGRTGAMGGPTAHWVSGQANRFYLRFTHHAKPLLAWYSHVHCSRDYAPSIFPLSFFLLQFLSLSLPPHFLCFSSVFLLQCFVHISFTLHLPPSLLPLAPSVFLALLKGAILNLASMPVSALALPPEGGRRAGGGVLVFSAIPLDEALEQGNESFGKGLETSHSSV